MHIRVMFSRLFELSIFRQGQARRPKGKVHEKVRDPMNFVNFAGARAARRKAGVGGFLLPI
jgi:hypothetical protein